MTHAGIQMLMEKLKQLINCNDIPFINNNPEIICERPKFQLLYEELGSMVQTLFVDQHQDLHDLGKLKDLKRRFIYAAEEAEYIFDMFLSDVRIRKNINFLAFEDSSLSLNLDDVRRTFISINEEFMGMRMNSMKMDSSETTLIQSPPVPISISTNSQGSNKLSDESVVGLHRDVELIRDKLVEDQKKVDVVSIVGMGGIGKTTLATKVFNDPFVVYHFHVRVWVSVSQTYDKQAVLGQILQSIHAQLGLAMATQLRLKKHTDSQLREMVHKSLMGRRFLIVIDDIWDLEAWDNLKLFFPHDNKGSRILLTSRFTEVAKHAKSGGLIHQMVSLNQERSWELLCHKVFHDNECPEWSIKPGMQIIENCKGLPLAVVVIAGVLAKEAWNRNLWIEIAERTGSYIVGEENGCLETLGLSYNHLPSHLRECFLYLGGFPEDYQIQVRWLIWLWVAEGFIEQDGNRRLEDIAEGYLIDLIDRNLVIVAHRSKYNGGVKSCKVHDLVRELCLKKAKEELFILETERLKLSSNFITTPYKPVRSFINTYDPSTRNVRSRLCFCGRCSSYAITTSFNSLVLLRVLDLQGCKLREFPDILDLLVHLRYLAIWMSSDFPSLSVANVPSSICNLWNLQTLIYKTCCERVDLPNNISDLVNLRHLWSNRTFHVSCIKKPMNLQTISHVYFDEASSFEKYLPRIKKLKCSITSDKQNDFKSLTFLEKLKLGSSPVHGKNCITFPKTLKTLSLQGCGLPWSEMAVIQSLPNLQVLKLQSSAFIGSCWNTNEQVFLQLKFLRLVNINVKQWEVYSTSFPCLRELKIANCYYLEEIPLEIGDIPTLELIEIKNCRPSVRESVRRIQQEQQDLGNYNLNVVILGVEVLIA